MEKRLSGSPGHKWALPGSSDIQGEEQKWQWGWILLGWRQPQGKPRPMLWASGYFQAAALPPGEAGEGVTNQRVTSTYTNTHWVYVFYAAYIKYACIPWDICKQTGHWPPLPSTSISGHQVDSYRKAASENSHCCPISGHSIVHMGLMWIYPTLSSGYPSPHKPHSC